jgi:5'-methylthioadenosine phosphorylase
MKTLGVERLISVSAVGSLQEQMKPRDMVTPTQLIDRTQHRPSTFFENGMVAHISFADPFCPHLRRLLAGAAVQHQVTLHQEGTLVVIEGPAFSTRAESAMYRQWGGSIIGMTALPEAKLAREAEMCYAVLACVTDYDVWHPHHDDVTVEVIFKVLQENIAASKQLLQALIPAIPPGRPCGCGSALENTIATARRFISPEARQRLGPLVNKYLA